VRNELFLPNRFIALDCLSVDPWEIPKIGEKLRKFQMSFGILWNVK